MSEFNEQRWALQMWIMSSHANDVAVNFNNKDMYVLESCSSYEGGDLKFELKAGTGWCWNLSNIWTSWMNIWSGEVDMSDVWVDRQPGFSFYCFF